MRPRRVQGLTRIDRIPLRLHSPGRQSLSALLLPHGHGEFVIDLRRKAYLPEGGRLIGCVCLLELPGPHEDGPYPCLPQLVGIGMANERRRLPGK